MFYTLTPYQEWLVLRRLIKENNIKIREFALTSKSTIEDLQEIYKTIAENFLRFDECALQIYEDKCKRDWVDSLSKEDLFSYFNFQNKILTKTRNNVSLGLIDTASFYVSEYDMGIFDRNVEFSGKPKKTEEDKKVFNENFEYNIYNTLLNNYEDFCEKKNFDPKNVDMVGDEKFFDFGRHNVEVKKEIAKFEEIKRQKAESENKKNSETPYFPEFEEYFKEEDNKSCYRKDFEF